MSADAALLAEPGVTGYVEALTETRVLGWAWAPGRPGRAVTAELVAGETVLASATADIEREDLRRNGIGDGCHAFSLEIPDAARGTPFRVVARLDDAPPVPLAMPPAAADATIQPLERIERALTALGNSQRLLHRNLQAVMIELREQRAAHADGTAFAAALEAPLRALDAGAMRIEERLAQKLEEPPAPRPARAWVLAAAALILAGAGAAWMLARLMAVP